MDKKTFRDFRSRCENFHVCIDLKSIIHVFAHVNQAEYHLRNCRIYFKEQQEYETISSKDYAKNCPPSSSIHRCTKAFTFQNESMYTCRYCICPSGKKNSFRIRRKQISTKQNIDNSAKYDELHAQCEQGLYLSVVRLRTLKHRKSPLFFMYVYKKHF